MDIVQKPKESRHHNWCFTIALFPPSGESWTEPTGLPDGLSYIVYQLEEGDDGLLHYQGYMESTNQCTLSAAKKKLGCRWAHLEPRRGTVEQAINYCAKPGGLEPVVEFGRYKRQGERSDLIYIKDRIQQGATELDLWQESFSDMVRYHKGITRAMQVLGPQAKRGGVQIIVLWGDPRAGKSVQAKHLAKSTPGGYYMKDPTSIWWDGYLGEKCVVMDDFDPTHHAWTWHQMFGWLDNEIAPAQVKGGYVQLQFTRLIITSNFNPVNWFKPDQHITAQAWDGRMTENDSYEKRFIGRYVKRDPNPEIMEID